MRSKIKFGYEIETGKEVEIPLSHTVITGFKEIDKLAGEKLIWQPNSK